MYLVKVTCISCLFYPFTVTFCLCIVPVRAFIEIYIVFFCAGIRDILECYTATGGDDGVDCDAIKLCCPCYLDFVSGYEVYIYRIVCVMCKIYIIQMNHIVISSNLYIIETIMKICEIV